MNIIITIILIIIVFAAVHYFILLSTGFSVFKVANKLFLSNIYITPRPTYFPKILNMSFKQPANAVWCSTSDCKLYSKGDPNKLYTLGTFNKNCVIRSIAFATEVNCINATTFSNSCNYYLMIIDGKDGYRKFFEKLTFSGTTDLNDQTYIKSRINQFISIDISEKDIVFINVESIYPKSLLRLKNSVIDFSYINV
jgi:hypothetical protein